MAIFLRKGWHLFNARNKQQSYPNQSTSLGQNCPPTYVWTEPKVHTQTHFLTAAKSKSASGCNFSCHCSTQNRFISRASRAKKTFLHFLFLNYFNNVYLPTYLPTYLPWKNYSECQWLTKSIFTLLVLRFLSHLPLSLKLCLLLPYHTFKSKPSSPAPINKLSCLKLHYAVFEHSDLLLKIFQPIRYLQTGVEGLGKYSSMTRRMIVVGSNPFAASMMDTWTFNRNT